MAKFNIEITETLQKVVEVEAESLTEAITKVAVDYGGGEIVLEAEDFKEYKIGEYKEE